MVMKKKEKAEVQAIIDRAEMLAALRWTAPVEKDVPPPSGWEYKEGWFINSHSMVVEKGWSGSVSHGVGPVPSEGMRGRSGSQRGVSMFSSKLVALHALRHAVEVDSAKMLLEIDRRIKIAMEQPK